MPRPSHTVQMVEEESEPNTAASADVVTLLLLKSEDVDIAANRPFPVKGWYVPDKSPGPPGWLLVHALTFRLAVSA